MRHDILIHGVAPVLDRVGTTGGQPPSRTRAPFATKHPRPFSLLGKLLMLALLLVMGASSTQAVLERVGPVVQSHGYPLWYQDTTGLVLEFGSPLNLNELQGSWVLLLPEDVPILPESFPDSFADEHFYGGADATIVFEHPDPEIGPTKANVLFHLEAAFAIGPPIPGDQVVFGRVRFRINNLPYGGDYTIYTPFGIWKFPDQVANQRLFHTEDIGLQAAPGDFNAALASHLGPFLLPSLEPGGEELPPVTPSYTGPTFPDSTNFPPGGAFTSYPGTGKMYIADPLREGPVTGSPIKTNYITSAGDRNPNIFRIECRNDLGEVIWSVETIRFELMGRIYDGVIPSRIIPERAVFARAGNNRKIDVFAQGQPTVQARLPGQAPNAPTMPILWYYNAPPTTNAGTGILEPPVGQNANLMDSLKEHFWKQSAPTIIPDAITLSDTRPAEPKYYYMPLTDFITITNAIFDPANGGSLRVTAGTSDLVGNPTLLLGGTNAFVNGVATISPLSVPESKVQVISTAGGFSELPITVLFGANVTPVSVNDSFTLAEDTTANLPVLANDTLNGSPIPAGATVVINTPPAHGKATVQADGTIDYTPNANYSGADQFTYTATANGVGSTAQAAVALTITSVFDAPTAIAGAPQTVPTALPAPRTVTLNGTGSINPEPGTLVYQWTQTGGQTVTLTGSATAQPTFSAPTLAPGAPAEVLSFQLVVDNGAASTPALTTVTIAAPVATPPTANAGPNQTVQAGAIVTLDGTGSTDPNGLALFGGWVQTAGTPIVTLSGANATTPTFIAPAVAIGQPSIILTFALAVTNTLGLYDATPDTVDITVNPRGLIAPFADAGLPKTVNSGATGVTLQGIATDSNNPQLLPMTYYWSQVGGTPTVTLAGENTLTATFNAPTLTAAQGPVVLTFAFAATNTATLGTSDTTTVTVLPPPDTVTITFVEYRVSTGRLTVNARSSVTSPNVVLTLKAGTGWTDRTMVNLGGGSYQVVVNSVTQQPTTITVQSSLGGTATVTSSSPVYRLR